jgi:hypothetical protein
LTRIVIGLVLNLQLILQLRALLDSLDEGSKRPENMKNAVTVHQAVLTGNIAVLADLAEHEGEHGFSIVQ